MFQHEKSQQLTTLGTELSEYNRAYMRMHITGGSQQIEVRNQILPCLYLPAQNRNIFFYTVKTPERFVRIPDQMYMIPGREEISLHLPHLPMQDNAPQQPQCQLVISINDVSSPNIHQFHLERSDQLYQTTLTKVKALYASASRWDKFTQGDQKLKGEIRCSSSLQASDIQTENIIKKMGRETRRLLQNTREYMRLPTPALSIQH